MRSLRPLLTVAGLVLLVATCVGWGVIQSRRLAVVANLTESHGGAVTVPEWTRETATGTVDGGRRLVVPGRNPETQQVIRQAAEGDHVQRRIEWDNPPEGRQTFQTAPTRWALQAVAAVEGALADAPRGVLLERAALHFSLWAQAVFGVLLVGGLARGFGFWAGVVGGVAWVTLAPLGLAFAPGVVEARTLALGVAALGAAALSAAVRGDRAGTWALAGLLAGVGIWVRADLSLLVVVAQLVALAVALRGTAQLGRLRIFGRVVAGVTLLAWAIEFLPGAASLRLESVHPLHALLVLGLAEAIAAFGAERRSVRLGTAIAGAAAVLAWVLTYALGPTESFAAIDPLVDHLPGLPALQATGVWGVFAEEVVLGFSLLAPLALAVFLVLRLWQQESSRSRARVAGAVCVALLTAWSVWQIHLMPLLVAVLVPWVAIFLGGEISSPGLGLTLPVPTKLPTGPWAWAGVAIFGLAGTLGLIVSAPARDASGRPLAAAADAESLVLRDVAHWLRARSTRDNPVILAPPDSAGSLGYFSAWRTVGNFFWENPEGTQGALRIASASSPDEAFELISKREVAYLVFPSWDNSLEALLASAYRRTTIPQQSFLAALQRWEQPRWLRPVAYPVPQLAGTENASVVVFEVVEEQDEVAAGCRLAEYLADTKRGDLAAALAVHLEGNASDLGALVARAYVAMAANNPVGFRGAMAAVPSLLEAGADGNLPWDRRVSLLVVLAQAQLIEQAKVQLSQLISTATEADLRSLAPNQLLRLVVLSRRVGVPFQDKALEELALHLLPPSVRSMK
ncbi:hypothetical protein [Nibricoccus sp. IMCC34717]|uniref:hypothetical protein n=1 Tax=Nibricoccus sp. IMCC34717 TaxID=3034021 RepID=UPI00384AD421